MTEVTEQDLLEAIQEALESPPPSQVPRCEPGTISTGYISRKLGTSQYKAKRVIDEMVLVGKLRPDWIGYTDEWNVTNRVKGYRLVQKNPAD